jgi:hypothetical protein
MIIEAIRSGDAFKDPEKVRQLFAALKRDIIVVFEKLLELFLRLRVRC